MDIALCFTTQCNIYVRLEFAYGLSSQLLNIAESLSATLFMRLFSVTALYPA